MMAEWCTDLIELSNRDPGWHMNDGELLDEHFAGRQIDAILLEMVDLFGRTTDLVPRFDRIVIDDVYRYIQGPCGPFHFIKDARASRPVVDAVLRSVVPLFRDVFTDDYPYTAATTWWDSFFMWEYQPEPPEDDWRHRDGLQARVLATAHEAAGVCRSGAHALEFLRQCSPSLFRPAP